MIASARQSGWFGQRRRAWWRALRGLLLLGLLAACEPDEEGGELSGAIGPGGGGPPVAAASVLTDALTTSSGEQIGTLSYDASYLLQVFAGAAADNILYIYMDIADPVVEIAVSRISGRFETPCRFSAAILARDQDFSIQASGDVVNAQGLIFHQVNLFKGDTFQRFYCTELRSNVGVQISAISRGGNKLDFEQMHFLLNSVTP